MALKTFLGSAPVTVAELALLLLWDELVWLLRRLPRSLPTVGSVDEVTDVSEFRRGLDMDVDSVDMELAVVLEAVVPVDATEEGAEGRGVLRRIDLTGWGESRGWESRWASRWSASGHSDGRTAYLSSE